jgi:predicted PurR-regulated permease PerM
MPKTPGTAALPWHDIAAWSATGVFLLLVLLVHLMPALLAGLLVHQLVHVIAPRLGRFSGHRAKVVVVAAIAVAVVLVLAAAAIGTATFIRGESSSFSGLLQHMADILDSSRAMLPDWLLQYLPSNADNLKATASEWLRTHAAEVQTVGKEAGRGLAHALIGMIIGAMVSLHEPAPEHLRRPFARALGERAARLAAAFRRIVFAQVKIAALNTVFTAIYLALVLPAAGIHLPLTKALVVITFLAGLLPVIGNLISNTVIVIISLSISLKVAIGSLAFLVLIHKLEYFLNARIVGGEISARAWELLVAMLTMEAAFGLPGVVAAPVYYAYLKDELRARGQV